MRKITTILFAFFVAMTTFAGPVSRQQALQQANAYLQKQRTTRGVTAKSGALTLAYECLPKATRGISVTTPLYYVFNQAKEQGFIVVAGDDRMTPVLGFVDEGSFAIDKVHESMQWWLDAVETTMLSVVKTADDGSRAETLADEDVSDEFKPFVSPLVKVNWGQGAPYNNRCPMDEVHKSRSLVGCTAVAMAQVLSRWQYPVHAEGKVNYTTGTHKFHISEDLSTFVFDWDKMLPNYSGNKGSEAEKAAVAELTYACGVAVQMNYCAQASGAFLYAHQLESHFGIDGGCNLLSRNYFTKAEWDRMAKNELSNGRPIIYFGYSMDAGHAFVCDGYDVDGLFHINWGWDGSMNGYFALAELNSAVEYAGAPTDEQGSFNIDQEMMIGIQPKQKVQTLVTEQLYFNTLDNVKSVVSRSNVKFGIKYVRTDGNGFDGSMTLGVYDSEDKFVTSFGTTHKLKLKDGEVYQDLIIGGVLPSSVSDGLYTLRPVCGKSAENYRPLLGRKSSPYYSYVTMKLEGNRINLTLPESTKAKFSIIGEAKPMEGKAYVGASNAIEIKLRNDGAMYNGPIILEREGEYDGGKMRVYANNYIVDAGEVLTIRANVKAPESGTIDKLNIWYAGNDADNVHRNGFTYAKLGTVQYALTTPTPGNPALSLKRFYINNKTTYIGEDLDVDVIVANNGGFYGNNVYAYIFPSGGGTSIGSAHKKVMIDKGEQIDFNMKVSIDHLDAGSYFMHFYWLDANGALQLMSDARYAFTIKSTASIPLNNIEGYGVFYVKHAYVLPETLQAGIVTAADDNVIKVNYCYAPGDTIPAFTPVVVKSGHRGSFTYHAVLSEERPPMGNCLRVDTDENGYTYAGEGDYWYYGFDDDGNRENYGMYWQKEQGAAFKLKARTAYIAVPVGKGKLSGYPFNAAVTGIENVFNNDKVNAAQPIYTISGVRVEGSLQHLPKGIYIVGGKKVFVK